MSKLINLKKWVSISEAAQHLTSILDEPVSAGNVLQLALDDNLKLSILMFGKGVKAVMGRIVTESESKTRDSDVTLWLPVSAPATGSSQREWQVFDPEGDLLELTGLYDLPMIGTTRFVIEQHYQSLTTNSSAASEFPAGVIVRDDDGALFMIRESIDERESVLGSMAHGEQIERDINAARVPAGEAARLREQHAAARYALSTRVQNMHELDHHMPTKGLPRNGMLVVRVNELSRFEKRVLGPEPPARRREAIARRVLELKAQGTRSYIKTVAKEEGLSESTVKKYVRQVRRDSQKSPTIKLKRKT